MAEKKKYPTKHLSVRVPWHDNGWTGKVCNNPRSNTSCLILKNVAKKKRDDKEELVAGRNITELKEYKRPACVNERMAFMAPFGYYGTQKYPYTYIEDFKHIKDTKYYYPPYSVGAIPSRWMLLDNFDKIKSDHNLNIDKKLEIEVRQKTGLDKKDWVNVYSNQKEILDYFFGHIKPKESLCFFYAKKVPFVEDFGRVLIGVGHVKDIQKGSEYDYSPEKDIKAMIWERIVSHSITEDDSFDGFLLPYHQAIQYKEEHPDSDFNVEDLAVLAPEDKISEFSYISEHVSNDTAIDVLLACAESIKKAGKYLKGPWDNYLEWIENTISDVWKMRGPYPGLGPALNALGLEFGNYMAIEIEKQVMDGEDPWEKVDNCFDDPDTYLPTFLAGEIKGILQDLWKDLSEDEINYLKLLSRFDLNCDQAKLLFDGLKELEEYWKKPISREDIFKNPYLIFELLRHTYDPVSFLTIDHGAFPDPEIKDKFPLPKESRVESGLDKRRIRALIIDILESATYEGHTLLPDDEIVRRIEERQLNPPCNVNHRILKLAQKYFNDVIKSVPMDGDSSAYQLINLVEASEIIRNTVQEGINSVRNELDVDWRAELDNYLDNNINKRGYDSKPCERFFSGSSNNLKNNKLELNIDDEELNAREEKALALKEIAESRFSVLVGSAGSGKTTLLAALCHNSIIRSEGIVLLAPTGKASVKMEQSIGLDDQNASTIAKFLLDNNRFDANTGRFKVLKKNAIPVGGTVIIDEASMLTEEMLASLLDSIEGYKRLILVGDKYQLPPIGAGRPFVDIISFLAPEDIEYKSKKIGRGYAELTVNRRQITSKCKRSDIEFAKWFRGDSISPGEDDILTDISELNSSDYLKFVRWNNENDFRELLFKVLIDILGLVKKDDYKTFNKSIGAFTGYFNVGAASMAECWQILSPVKNWKHGVLEINRAIHQSFKGRQISQRWKDGKKPYPMGLEGIIIGEKVINTKNHHHKKYEHGKGLSQGYVANGEIGIIVSEFNDYGLNIEFSSQPKKTFGFIPDHFKEGKDRYSIELAYALTVHKAQGSEFGKVILVIPEPCPLVSRELLYTALTRQKSGIILLHQGNPVDLLKYSSPEYSETLKRYTNLFKAPKPIEINGKFLEENLIHTTSRKEAVRSKSEVIIADRLAAAGINYNYEREIVINGIPKSKYPDFTIYDKRKNIYYYWEHLGMLSDRKYKNRWEKKLQWYRENDIIPYEEGIGKNGILITTEDDSKGGISSYDIDNKINEIFGIKSFHDQDKGVNTDLKNKI